MFENYATEKNEITNEGPENLILDLNNNAFQSQPKLNQHHHSKNLSNYIS